MNRDERIAEINKIADDKDKLIAYLQLRIEEQHEQLLAMTTAYFEVKYGRRK